MANLSHPLSAELPEALAAPVAQLVLPAFDLPRPAEQCRIVVAMSGGVDSSVVAALATLTGAEVIGVTLQLYDHGAAVKKPGACCAGQDIHDARRVADRLGIAHYVLDYEERFRKAVINDFASSYAAGRTPVPCIRCNERVKFGDLLTLAEDLGADILATGHYAQRLPAPPGLPPELHRAVDAARDQSYFLFATALPQLARVRFPLGGLPKDRVRAIAAALGLAVAAKPDSQDICFVPNGHYAQLVARLAPEAAAAGAIVEAATGRQLGQHEGIAGFTVGQRRGLGIGGTAEPVYVTGIDAAQRRVQVGPKAALLRDRVFVETPTWLVPPESLAGAEGLSVRLRSTMQPVAVARVTLAADGGGIVDLAEPYPGVAPGQAAVLSQGSRILGGGWIAGSERRPQPEPAAA